MELKNSPTFESDIKFIQKLTGVSKKHSIELPIIIDQAQQKIEILREEIYELFSPLLTQKHQLRIQFHEINDLQTKLERQKQLAKGAFRCCYEGNIPVLETELNEAMKYEKSIRKKIKNFDEKNQNKFEKLCEKRDEINAMLQNLINKDYFDTFQVEFSKSISMPSQPDIVQEFPVLPQRFGSLSGASGVAPGTKTAPYLSDTLQASGKRGTVMK